MHKISTMRSTYLLPLLALSLLSLKPAAFDIRQAYAEIPLKYLPLTREYVKGKTDNSETRDEILTYHNRDREYLSIRLKDNVMEGQMQLYKSGGSHYIVVEHTGCKRTVCENEFVILKKEGSDYVDVTRTALKDSDLNLSNIRGELKKAFKEAYGGNDPFKDSGYKDDETLKSHLYWHLDNQSGVIYLKESSLPHIIATYKWNEKKAVFAKQ